MADIGSPEVTDALEYGHDYVVVEQADQGRYVIDPNAPRYVVIRL